MSYTDAIIGISLASIITLVIILFIDIVTSWVVIYSFFRYKLWNEREIVIIEYPLTGHKPVIRVSQRLFLERGTFANSFDFVVDDTTYMHIPIPWYLGPLSSLCLRIMRSVHYPRLDEARQLIDL